MPKTYSQEQRDAVIEHVIDEITKGRSLTTACQTSDPVVSYSQWMRWQLADEDLRERIARAREAGATKLLEEVIEIADAKDEDSNSRRVRIYAREKYAAMIAPQRFGQKVDITSGGKALPQPVQASTDRIDALLALAMQRRQLDAPTAMIDVTPSPSLDDVMG